MTEPVEAIEQQCDRILVNPEDPLHVRKLATASLALVAEVRALRAQLAQVVGALTKYGRHDGCSCDYGSRGERVDVGNCELTHALADPALPTPAPYPSGGVMDPEGVRKDA